MGIRKTSPANRWLIDLYEVRICLRPLFGLNRLVKVPQRKKSGIAYCDHVIRVMHSITFSKANARTSLYRLAYGTRLPGLLGEPWLNFIDETTELLAESTKADLRRLHDDGTNAVICFTPKRGETYAAEWDVYKPFDPGSRAMGIQMPSNVQIATYAQTLDLSAYLSSGYKIEGPRCEFESDQTNGKVRGAGQSLAHRPLPLSSDGKGVWSGNIENVVGGTIRLTWENLRPNRTSAISPANLERLATELSVNPRLAKDLHNFVSVCHHFAAGIRTLNGIGPAMITNRLVVNRSLRAVEDVLGTELIRRMQGIGLIAITPAGHAVLDWWSQYYMQWAPIASQRAAGPVAR